MPVAEAFALTLVCLGGGTIEKGDYGEEVRERPFSGQVDVEIKDGKGRIRMPPAMLHWVVRGGDGWVKLKRLRITDRTIDGLASTNLFDMPRVRIDRVTGTISIAGEESGFSGRCEVSDATAPAKF